jgi:tRNA pseudouridine synthase 10
MQRFSLNEITEQEIFKTISKAITETEFSTFTIGITSKNPELKNSFSQKIKEYMTTTLSKKFTNKNFELYILINIDKGILEIKTTPIFIYGHYNKFSRNIAQTFHYCFKCKGKGCKYCKGTGKLSEHSVQEILEKYFIPAFKATKSKFHGCGREDVDVRMLGSGRPFIIELINPIKRNFDLALLEKKINSKHKKIISISNLRFSEKKEVERIKNSEFEKIYSALCHYEGNLKETTLHGLIGKEYLIFQRTPQRVEKRRTDKERIKKAKLLSAKIIGKNLFSIEIKSSHGLYIKEFISGDNGRTKPSISELLGVKCVCKELDVLEILIEQNTNKK